MLDCEWCVVDSDGKTHLDKSYCAPQKECFGGIVGAKSPYVDDTGAIGMFPGGRRGSLWRHNSCPSPGQRSIGIFPVPWRLSSLLENPGVVTVQASSTPAVTVALPLPWTLPSQA